MADSLEEEIWYLLFLACLVVTVCAVAEGKEAYLPYAGLSIHSFRGGKTPTEKPCLVCFLHHL